MKEITRSALVGFCPPMVVWMAGVRDAVVRQDGELRADRARFRLDDDRLGLSERGGIRAQQQDQGDEEAAEVRHEGPFLVLAEFTG